MTVLRNYYITKERVQTSQSENPTLLSATQSDRSRIIYSSPFKRMAQKAQVFSLESNSAVRSRLSHSLEVADMGIRICRSAFKRFNQQREGEGEYISRDEVEAQQSFTNTVECACLLHDIGNPPFGHLGENAIRRWFRKYLCSASQDHEAKTPLHWHDFLEFDGNPQGLRIFTRLMTERDIHALNLTYSTMLAFLKYVRMPGEESDPQNPSTKKPGLFHTEADIFSKAIQSVGLGPGQRHPCSYVMEAADDISYCLSDIEDGIEKGMLKPKDFLDLVGKPIRDGNLGFTEQSAQDFDAAFEAEDWGLAFFCFKTGLAIAAQIHCSQKLLQYITEDKLGQMGPVIEKADVLHESLEQIKLYARKTLFRTPDAENPELAGFAIISGLLEKYEQVLSLPADQFQILLKGKGDPKLLSDKLKDLGVELDYEFRLTNHLPDKYIAAYQHMV